MSLSSTLVVLLASSVLASGLDNVFDSIDEEVRRTVADLGEIPAQGLFTGISAACPSVRLILGLGYDQLEDRHPDLSRLSLDFISNNINYTINLTAADTLIPEIPGFNPDANFIIFLHGFNSDPTADSFTEIRDAFYSKGNYHVLALDSSSMISWFYLRSSTYVRMIGERLGTVLAALVNNSGVQKENIHMVGHSLGAHIASFAGKTFQNLTSTKIGRITGLDPAGPCFSFMTTSLRLNSTDADFVDVIHTDGGVLGLKAPIGQVDYYPNEGESQPDCTIVPCSHGRSWQYFAESIVNTTAFPSVKCDSWNQFQESNCSEEISYMGYPSSPGTTGKFYLETRGESPFSLGKEGLVYRSQDSILRRTVDGIGSAIVGGLRTLG